jgi:hypothetical protein
MRDLSVIDGIGFVAAALVLATFCMRSMTALRWVALASNLAFIAYAYRCCCRSTPAGWHNCAVLKRDASQAKNAASVQLQL